ncbi:hypothetical protein CCB80_04530 [Armatimonadetes bacterium Uphvl-Ar1]|nr:hypothetical protein CCB80_04530 [Armatimonadetes bacterium Uphvl-Ar1]
MKSRFRIWLAGCLKSASDRLNGKPIVVATNKEISSVDCTPISNDPHSTSRFETEGDSAPLDKDQLNALRVVFWSFDQIFLIVGGAGSGKSRLVKEFSNRSGIVCCAPTGIAALRINGKTLHSMFHLPTTIQFPNLIQGLYGDRAEQIKNCDMIIIDEISMVRADVFDAVDKKLRMTLNSEAPFGGKKIVLVGDMSQLPPVLGSNEQLAYFNNWEGKSICNSSVFDLIHPRIIELRGNHRQASDKYFSELLNSLRKGVCSNEILDQLNERIGPAMNKAVHVTLNNAKAESINHLYYARLQTKEHSFPSLSTPDQIDKFIELCQKLPVPRVIKVKVGCRVIICANSDSYKNGDSGTISLVSGAYIRVKLDRTGMEVEVPRNTFTAFDYFLNPNTNEWEPMVAAEYVQFPILLGYAITVYKAQGLTLHKVHIHNEGGFWDFGQAYTAISRVRNLLDFSCEQPFLPSDFLLNPEIEGVYQDDSEIGF